MTAVEFITAAYADAWTYDEKPSEITPEEAAAIISEWKAEGIEVPVMVTPVLFSSVWNIYCKK